MSKDLIEALGGVKPLSDALETTPGAVANWRLRDTIPWRYRHSIARIAAERGVSLPDGFWDATPKAAA